MRGSVKLTWRQEGERSENQTWKVVEYGSGEVKSQAWKKQRQESRKAENQVRPMWRQVTVRMRG